MAVAGGGDETSSREVVFSKKGDAGGAEAPAREVKSKSEWDQHLQGSGQEKPIQGKQWR